MQANINTKQDIKSGVPRRFHIKKLCLSRYKHGDSKQKRATQAKAYRWESAWRRPFSGKDLKTN